MRANSLALPCRIAATFFVFLAAVSLSAPAVSAASADEFIWHSAVDFEIEGRGWTETESPYDRLPTTAKPSVPGSVWGLSKNSAGLCVRFETTAKTISVRWDLISEGLAMPHMPATGVSGVDLYCRAPGASWQFIQNGRPGQRANNMMTAAMPATRDRLECLVYLPLYNGVSKVEIGIPQGAVIERASPRPELKRKPIVYYGTSIAQGGCASRPGMAFTAMVGRSLDRPVVNLGFSGSGKMEPAVSALLAELDPAVYVVDCLWNIGGVPEPEIRSRIDTLVAAIRKTHPRTPILFVGQSKIHNAGVPTGHEIVQFSEVERLQHEGTGGLYRLPGKGLLGMEDEGTVDGVHPNDLGMRQHAMALTPAIADILRKSSN